MVYAWLDGSDLTPDRQPGERSDARHTAGRGGVGQERGGRGGEVQKAIEVLMNEHRLIEKVLGSLETFVSQVEGRLKP
jgi:hypothetical protein